MSEQDQLQGAPFTTRPLPRVKLDLTADERILPPPVPVDIFHPYSAMPEDGIEVPAYDYVEAFTETSGFWPSERARAISMML
ncbi:hypothetical protein ACVIIV_002959 [Bradyrhizobium sp. USDA 4354]